MNSIIEQMYGGGADSKPQEPDSGSGYYNSFAYYDDLKNNRPPPTADQGGPTALELAQQYGAADEQGMLANGMNAVIAAMYGGGIAPINPSNNSMNPNYGGAMRGDTMGGVGDTDAWYNDILWSTPDPNKGTYGVLEEGGTFQTPAGDYKVIKNPWGQYELVPLDGAPGGVGPSVTNITNGEHHIGINPQTGEVWYQQAAGYYNYDGQQGYTQTQGAPTAPNGPSGPNNPSNGGKSWEQVLADRDLADQFPANNSRIDNRSVNEGLFKSLSHADSYAQMLKNLGLRG